MTAADGKPLPDRGGVLRLLLPVWFVPAAIATLVAQIAGAAWWLWPDTSDAPPVTAAVSDGKVTVTYVLSGDRPNATISYKTPNGQEAYDSRPLPFHATYRFDKDEYITLSVQNRYQNGAGTVMCTIVVDGRVVRQSTGSGSNEIASCYGTIDDMEPVPGAKVPPTNAPPASGLRAGEVRLTKVVPVPRYKGKGSPVVGRVTDDDARLSYVELGGEWGRSRATDPELDDLSRKQKFHTEAKWVATIATGLVDSDDLEGARGKHRLRTVTASVQDRIQHGDFPGATVGRDVASQPVEVSGRPGWVIVREFRFEESGVKAKADLSAVVVVDTGRALPSLLWIDLPETHRRLWPDINTVIESIRLSR